MRCGSLRRWRSQFPTTWTCNNGATSPAWNCHPSIGAIAGLYCVRSRHRRSYISGRTRYSLVRGVSARPLAPVSDGQSMAEGLAQLENARGIKPALISIEDGWQIGYVIEPL